MVTPEFVPVVPFGLVVVVLFGLVLVVPGEVVVEPGVVLVPVVPGEDGVVVVVDREWMPMES